MAHTDNTKQFRDPSSGANGEILVAVFDNTIYVKPFGFATQQNALGLPDFLNCMFRNGHKKVTVDLEKCSGMDSTFLGVIATAALSPSSAKKNVVIINAGDEAKMQLQRIGLMDVIAFKEEPCPPPPDLQLSHIDFFHLPSSEKERVCRIKELHQQLIRLNEKNRKKFGSFIKMLDEELDK